MSRDTSPVFEFDCSKAGSVCTYVGLVPSARNRSFSYFPAAIQRAARYRYSLDGREWATVGQLALVAAANFLPVALTTIRAVTALRWWGDVAASCARHFSFLLRSGSNSSAAQLEYRVQPGHSAAAGQPPPPWKSLPVGAAAARETWVSMGARTVQARVAGLSSDGTPHPAAAMELHAFWEAPRTVVRHAMAGAGGGLNVSVGVGEYTGVCPAGCGVAAVWWSVDGGSWKRGVGDHLVLTGLAAGSHVVEVVAETGLGNIGLPPRKLSVAIGDGTAPRPSLFLQSAPGTESVATSAEFSVGGVSAHRYWWRLDGGAWAAGVSPQLRLRDLESSFHVWYAQFSSFEPHVFHFEVPHPLN